MIQGVRSKKLLAVVDDMVRWGWSDDRIGAEIGRSHPSYARDAQVYISLARTRTEVRPLDVVEKHALARTYGRWFQRFLRSLGLGSFLHHVRD